MTFAGQGPQCLKFLALFWASGGRRADAAGAFVAAAVHRRRRVARATARRLHPVCSCHFLRVILIAPRLGLKRLGGLGAIAGVGAVGIGVDTQLMRTHACHRLRRLSPVRSPLPNALFAPVAFLHLLWHDFVRGLRQGVLQTRACSRAIKAGKMPSRMDAKRRQGRPRGQSVQSDTHTHTHTARQNLARQELQRPVMQSRLACPRGQHSRWHTPIRRGLSLTNCIPSCQIAGSAPPAYTG